MGREEIKEALSILSKYIDHMEEKDPQYLWVSKVARKHGIKALPVVVGNALVSYRLSGTGEQYWEEFGKYFLKYEPSVDSLIQFIKLSKYNKVMKEQKLKRIEKVRKTLIELADMRYSNLDLIRERLKRALKAKGTEKTLVFALKMAYYLFKSLGVNVEGDVELPIDSRIATLTCSSGLIDANVEEIMSKRRDEAIRLWSQVAHEVGIKTLHLDALLWLPAKGLRKALCKGLSYGREVLKKNLEEYGIEEAERIASLIVRRACC